MRRIILAAAAWLACGGAAGAQQVGQPATGEPAAAPEPSAPAQAAAPATPVVPETAFHGMWSCQFQYSEFNNFGQWQSGYSRTYGINIAADRTYQVQGSTAGVFGPEPFTSQGKWESGGDGTLIARGEEFGPNIFPGMQFIHITQLDPGGRTMRLVQESKDVSNTRVMTRGSTLCEKPG